MTVNVPEEIEDEVIPAVNEETEELTVAQSTVEAVADYAIENGDSPQWIGDVTAELIDQVRDEYGYLEWVSAGRFRPSKAFVHTRCGSNAGRLEPAPGKYTYVCPVCDERTSLNFGDIEFVTIDASDEPRGEA